MRQEIKKGFFSGSPEDGADDAIFTISTNEELIDTYLIIYTEEINKDEYYYAEYAESIEGSEERAIAAFGKTKQAV